MQIPVGYKEVDGIMVEMTIQERVDAGIITQEDATQMASSEEIDKLLLYLKNTDWYAVRKAETGVDIPVNIILERQNARDRISELR